MSTLLYQSATGPKSVRESTAGTQSLSSLSTPAVAEELQTQSKHQYKIWSDSYVFSPNYAYTLWYRSLSTLTAHMSEFCHRVQRHGRSTLIIVNPIDDVEKLPCMTNDRSNSMPLNQRLFHKPHILVRSTLLFSFPLLERWIVTQYFLKSTRTIKINKAKQYQIISLAILLVHSL